MIFLLVLVGHPYQTISQCIPDTENCIDINEPGQICPAVLATGTVGQAYEEHITIIAPDSAALEQNVIGLVKIRLDAVGNLPPGINYSSEHMEFFPNQAYCVSISGVPLQSGTYYLKITVTPFIMVFTTLISLPAQTDSTSVFMIIEPSTSINYQNSPDFALINPYPNPFESATRIGFISPSTGETELVIFNMLGKIIYREKIISASGLNYFNYDGGSLPPGYYSYAIIREQGSLKGRLVKSR